VLPTAGGDVWRCFQSPVDEHNGDDGDQDCSDRQQGAEAD